MARTADQIIQEQLGQLTYNIAVLGARLERALDENAKLKSELAALTPADPAKEVE